MQPEQSQPEASSDQDDQTEQQTVPSGELSAVGEQDENGNENAAAAIAETNAKEELMTREEALKMLQAVRDRDMLRRMQQEEVKRSRHVRVDRDW